MRPIPLALGLAAALAGFPAQAQEGGAPVVLGPITVTGERVERTVAETPSSVVVVTGEELEDTPAREIVEEVLERIPNITATGGTNEAPAIRGVNTTGVLSGADAFLGGSRPRSTVTLDGRPLSANEYIFDSYEVSEAVTLANRLIATDLDVTRLAREGDGGLALRF